MKRIGLALLLLLAACGTDRSAGGGGIETNNTLGLRILDSLGNPAPFARVDLLPADWIDSGSAPAPVRSGRTDEFGFLSMSLPDGRWTLEASGNGASGLRTFHLSSDLELSSIRLAKPARLTGNVYQEYPGQRVRIAVPGTTHSVVCDSSGAYALDALPPTAIALRTISGSARTDSVTLSPGSSVTLRWTGHPDLRSLDTDGSILIDDFSGARPSISSADTAAGWYMASDGRAGLGSVIRRADNTPDSVFSRFFVPNQPVGQIASFQGFFDIDTSLASTRSLYAQIGISFHDTSRCIDLSALDSITFLASGTDSVRAEFLGRINYTTPDFSATPGRWVGLDSTWRRVSLRTADFATPAGSTHPEIGWASVGGCVNEFRFFTTRPAHLRLSNLRFWGAGLSNFLHPIR